MSEMRIKSEMLHRVYGDGVCLNRTDTSSCWTITDEWRETDFRFYMANTPRLLFLSDVFTRIPGST